MEVASYTVRGEDGMAPCCGNVFTSTIYRWRGERNKPAFMTRKNGGAGSA
jgi:hypothetical protein